MISRHIFYLDTIYKTAELIESEDKYILKYEFKDYKIIQQEERQANKILNSKFPAINLPNLLNEKQTVNLQTDKLILVDFWEVWCGPCISSFPKVEHLKNEYSDILKVVGIVTEDKENAVKLIEKKGTTFLNLFGTKKLLKEYSVNSYPRYFLIDKKGIVQKEYFGFSEQIEKDIKELTSE